MGSRKLSRLAGAVFAGILLVPLGVSAASADPDHPEPPEDVVEAPGDVTPTDIGEIDWNDYERVLLSKDTGEPIDLAVLPDNRVLHTARDGVIRLTDPDTGTTHEVADLDVYQNSEDGLQGIALDPNFEENNLVYLVYAPAEMDGNNSIGNPYPTTTPQGSAPNSIDGSDSLEEWEQWLGYNVLARFTFDPATNVFDLDSEEEILRVETQRGQCCHVGADLAWDAEGNLYMSTGDNTPASTPGANGYTPINNAPGLNPGFDSRRGAGNTNDLRGAILRITPIDEIAEGAETGPDSTYTIPAGNLFDSDEYDPELVREEIYVMGLRNPFRIDYDQETGALVWGDYGPDAGSAQADRGPMGYVEWQATTEPMNGGWPYCHGPNDGGAYNEWDYANNQPGELTFDCENGPVNNSSWNTGEVQLPPVTEPQIWYGDNPGDQPAEWDDLVLLGGGGQAPMGGPVYRFDEANESDRAFPELWDGLPLMAEFSQDYVVAFEMDELSSAGSVTSITDFLPNAHLENTSQPLWDNPMDIEFGPDGALYALDYGDGFFRQNPDAGLYRVNYAPDNKTPQARFSADPISSSTAPLEVSFDASESRDPEGGELTYEWDFNSDGEVDATGVTTTYTFAELGQYEVTLRVTDPEGKIGLSSSHVTVGNTAPELALSVEDGAIFNWGDAIPMSISVTDAEDGDDINCDRVNWTFGLGHNTHAHPEVTGTGCDFTIQTDANAVEHGEGEKIYGTFVANYTDNAQGEVPATTGEATLIVKPEVQQAEWYDDASGVEVVDDAAADAGSYVTGFGEGSYVAFTPLAFSRASDGADITTVSAQASGEGTVSLSWNDSGAEPFATIDFASDEWTEVSTELEEIPEGSGTVYVSATEGVDVDFIRFTAEEVVPPEEPVCEDPDAEITADDEFDGTEVDACRWEIVDFDGDLANVSDGFYNVTTTDDDFNGAANSTVPNILQNRAVTGDQWTVETSFNALLESTYHQGGIIVLADEDNYVKIDPIFQNSDEGLNLRMELRSEVDGAIQDPQVDVADLPLPEDGNYFVRLTRDGDTFTGSYSFDGETWTDMPEGVTNANVGDATPGVFALGKSQEAPTTVSFDYFRVVEDTPDPEYPTDWENIPAEQVSIQMFSLIPWVSDAGLEPVLDRLSSIGFVNIEPFGGTFGDYSAEDFRSLIDSYGLSAPSSHYNVAADTFDETLEFVSTVGQEYVGSGGWPAPGIGSLDDVLATAQAMNELGERSVENGTGKIFGHNHAAEFTTQYEYNGELTSAWEILVAETDPEFVTFELDVAWAAHAGVDVPGLIQEYGDRIELLHVKDATNLGGDRPTFTNLGDGDVPLDEILAVSQESANITYYVLEYDQAADGEDFATTGYEFLTGQDAGQPDPEYPTDWENIPAENVSIQMYSLVPWTDEAGDEAVYDRLSEIGFLNIEPYGGTYGDYTAEEFRSLIDSYGLSAPTSHYQANEDTWDETLEFLSTVGHEYTGTAGWPAPGIGSLEDVLATADAMDRLGERSVEAGTGKFFGHNHDQEFTTQYEYNGELTSAWEILAQETDPEFVTFELDVAWATHAGVDVPGLIQEYGDRIELLHIKDATNLGGEGNPTFTNLGDGEVPLDEILAVSQESANIAYYVLEYDLAADGEDFATTGYEFLTGEEAGEPSQPDPEPVPPSPGRGFYLNDGWDIWADHEFSFGRPGDSVIVGDWDGDGTDTLGVRRGNAYFLSNSLFGGNADEEFTFGRAGDEVLVGDWNRDGADTFAVRRGNAYFLTNTLEGGNASIEFTYGRATDTVLVGDWNGDGTDTFAVRRGNTYFLNNTLGGGVASAVFDYGRANDEIFVGDWDGDDSDTFAVRRGNTFFVNNSLTSTTADFEVNYGRASDEVFVGDWNGDGVDSLGIRR
jgi:sugar phosphate isomerase/epimerase/glucose/arabinose dehydrogenase/regulation of enolase protein 1 (concanavalin A-like superfamily)